MLNNTILLELFFSDQVERWTTTTDEGCFEFCITENARETFEVLSKSFHLIEGLEFLEYDGETLTIGANISSVMKA